MKQARIECPHCGGNITVRQAEEGATIKFVSSRKVSPKNEDKIWSAVDEMFRATDAGFKKIFNPKLWRS